MVFKGPAGFQRIVYIVMNVVIGVVVTLCLNLLVTHEPIVFAGFLQSVVLSFFIGYCASDLVPAMAWGQKLAAKLGLVGGVGAHFVSSAVLAFFMGTIILFFCAFINVFAAAGMLAVLGFFASAYGVVLLAAYASILVFLPIGMKIARAISGFDPAAAGADSAEAQAKTAAAA